MPGPRRAYRAPSRQVANAAYAMRQRSLQRSRRRSTPRPIERDRMNPNGSIEARAYLFPNSPFIRDLRRVFSVLRSNVTRRQFG